jgi:uncharacterized protein
MTTMTRKTGRFDWYDLMTTDVAGAKAFYTKTLGWKMAPWDQGDYEMWSAGDMAIGGVMALPPELKKLGVPPHWMAYIETDDVDATAKKAQQLGGKIANPPADIPKVGRFAVLTDPQGVSFAVFKPLEGVPDMPHKAGFFSWHELHTTDNEAAWKFYAELFGWKHTRSMDMGPGGTYRMFGLDSQNSMGGMSNMAKVQNTPPYWLYYVSVDNLDTTVADIQKNGGKILNGPMEVPGGDRIAMCMDPQGGMFAVHMAAPKK